MKKSKGISLVLSPVLGAMMLTACGDEPAARDVYQSKDECAKDWGGDLCDQMNDSDAEQYRSSHGHSGGYYFWGPMYYGSNRSVMYQGRTVTPAGRSSTLAAYSVTSRSSSASRTGKSSPVTTGGFGGRSGSSSSSS